MRMADRPLVLVVDGPNLGRLGRREPDIYGTVTRDGLLGMMAVKAAELGLELETFRSDVEGELVRFINDAAARASALVINPAAYSHYSIALMDAMGAFDGPVLEVHISQVLSREPFRRRMVTAMEADVFIAGAGVDGYLHALDLAARMLSGARGGSGGGER